MCGHSCLILLFRIDCVFIMLFTKQVFIFPKIHIVYFTKHQRGRFIKSFDISYSDIFEIYIMDTQMLEAINYIRNVSKKKVTMDRILTYLNNAGASNWDKESVEVNLKEMQTRGIINENYKPFVTLSSKSPDFSIIQYDVCITLQVDSDVISATTNPVILTHTSGPAIDTPNIGSFVTPSTRLPFHSNSVISLSFSSKLDSLEANVCDRIMAMKSFFMDELQTIKNET